MVLGSASSKAVRAGIPKITQDPILAYSLGYSGGNATDGPVPKSFTRNPLLLLARYLNKQRLLLLSLANKARSNSTHEEMDKEVTLLFDPTPDTVGTTVRKESYSQALPRP